MAEHPHIDGNGDQQTLLALDRELRELATFEVSRAAKERGWVALARELERRPVGRAASAPAWAGLRGVFSGRGVASGRRLSMASLAAAVVVIALVLGIYSGTVWLSADNGQGPGSLTSLVSAGATPSSNVSLPSSSAASSSIVSTETTPASTEQTTSATASVPTTPSGGVSGGTGSTATTGTVPTGGSATTVRPTTTQPRSTTTTAPPSTNPPSTVYATSQRDKTAKTAALDFAASVMDYFMTGNLSGAYALVAPQAQSALVQMIYSLEDPQGFRWVSTKDVSADTARVILEFQDRVANGQGELQEVSKRYALTIKVTDSSARVIAITAAP